MGDSVAVDLAYNSASFQRLGGEGGEGSEGGAAFSDSVIGAHHCCQGASVHPRLFLQHLARAAEANGAELRLNARVTRLEPGLPKVPEIALSSRR